MRRSPRLLLALVVVVAVAAVALAVELLGGDGSSADAATNRAFPSAKDPDKPATVWAVGDGSNTGRGRELGHRIAVSKPARFLYLGDVYEGGSPEDFGTDYSPAYGQLRRITAPTPGNHDWPAHAEGYDPYWQKATGHRTPGWYAFSIGGWRIISLNSEAPHGPRSAQLRWLGRELRGAKGTCRLAFWHRPLESSGPHGDNPDVAPFYARLRGKASIVLNGHDHNSQRLRPKDGIAGYVAGAGGRGLYATNTSDPRLRWVNDQDYAALRLELRRGRADMTYVTGNGTVLDRSTVRCKP